MKTVNIGPHVVEMYESIFELPAYRESLMSYHQLTEAGIGNGFESIDEHLNILMSAVFQDDKQSAYTAVENLRMCYWATLSKYSAKYLSWLCTIHSVDGQPIGTSDEELGRLAEKLGQYPGDAEFAWAIHFAELKKKLPTSFEGSTRTGEEMDDLIDSFMHT